MPNVVAYRNSMGRFRVAFEIDFGLAGEAFQRFLYMMPHWKTFFSISGNYDVFHLPAIRAVRIRGAKLRFNIL